MPFDIYGQRLRAGHCEVHPDVHEQYPCGDCMDDSYRSEPEPTYSIEDECFGRTAHAYHGEDVLGPRCYCGTDFMNQHGPLTEAQMIERESYQRQRAAAGGA